MLGMVSPLWSSKRPGTSLVPIASSAPDATWGRLVTNVLSVTSPFQVKRTECQNLPLPSQLGAIGTNVRRASGKQ